MSSTATEMVAVLMTDLVGSTAMADRVGPEVAEELRTEHFGLLRGALERAGGREVKNLGDGLMVVFDGAAQSLACAVQMQQAVEARNRRAEEQLGVRIGVSVGDTTLEDGDYFGEPVVESSRLCAHAAGGQIVVNALVRQLAGSRDGHSFQSLGGLELKGIAEPVQAFELQWEPAATQSAIALPERLRELPETAYVGRLAERERLRELWEQAREGSLRVALVSGEAGVGKTRLSTHLALAAHGEGATVLFGRCDEDLGVPYQPWVQALGYLVKEAPQPLLDEHVERFGNDLARLVPALSDRVADLPPARDSDPETERYLMYAAVAGLLEVATQHEPLLFVLDDLHWADSPTLSLLRHVVTAGSAIRVMVVGTYRDSDLSREHPLTALLADLHREQGVGRIGLTGLDSNEIFALMEAAAGHELGEDGQALATQITRETAGNPFFAGEVLRHLTESGALEQGEGGRWRLVGNLTELGLPQSVREVVGRRVERLGPEARTALSAAAVIGRDFDLDLLLSVLDLSEERLLDLLEEAVAASLLNESAKHGGHFNFTHGLVEHTLYEDLGSTRRARLHKRIGEALEELCGDEPGERLGELAGHWAAAVVSADAAKAIHYARRAAERALALLAPDEAARWYRQALELYDQMPGGEPTNRCELLIGLGEAQRQVGNADYRGTLLDAAALAQEVGDTDRLCRAVLANSRGWFSQVLVVDSERVKALEAAARALPHEDSRRARVLGLLALELIYSDDRARCRALANEALEIARAASDPVALARTLQPVVQATWGPDTLAERQLLLGELSELARHLEDPRLGFFAAEAAMMVGTEIGDREQVQSNLASMRTLASSVPEPFLTYVVTLHDAGWARVEGHLEESERLALAAFEAGTASGQPDALQTLGALLSHVRTAQGRSGELIDQVVQFADGPDSASAWRAAAARILLENGHEDEARTRALAEDVSNVPRDPIWLAGTFIWADVFARLGASDRAAELYGLLEPLAGQLVVAGQLVYESVDWALGELSRTLERYEDAERHFAASVEIEARLGAPLSIARSRVGWARTLIARGRPADLDRATQMLEQAEETAGRLDGGLVTREAAQCRAALAAISA
jgi:class 3 adenylate cyclase/tetratricopeptide (TPR) repeat protein